MQKKGFLSKHSYWRHSEASVVPCAWNWAQERSPYVNVFGEEFPVRGKVEGPQTTSNQNERRRSTVLVVEPTRALRIQLLLFQSGCILTRAVYATIQALCSD